MSIKKCKRCGCELPSDARGKLCESCKTRRNEKIGCIGGIALSIVGVVTWIIKTILNKNSN